MRLTTKPNTPGHEEWRSLHKSGKKIRVFLDDVEQNTEDIREVDEEAGYLLHSFSDERKRGKVRIVIGE